MKLKKYFAYEVFIELFVEQWDFVRGM